MIKARFYEKDLGLAKLMTTFSTKEGSVGIGVLRSSGVYKGAENMTVAQVAAIHEFGSKDGSIPERSFMRTAVFENKGSINKLIKGLAVKITDGAMGRDKALGIIGEYVKGLIKNRIRSGPFVPNAPETIRRKGSSKPLIDTGQLINSIDWELTGKKARAK